MESISFSDTSNSSCEEEIIPFIDVNNLLQEGETLSQFMESGRLEKLISDGSFKDPEYYKGKSITIRKDFILEEFGKTFFESLPKEYDIQTRLISTISTFLIVCIYKFIKKVESDNKEKIESQVQKD